MNSKCLIENIPIVWNEWSKKSSNINFKSSKRGIGNGEEKLKYELDIIDNPKGQNSCIDLIHKDLGCISVKDMTKNDCRLGVEASQILGDIFKRLVIPIILWCDKYRDRCRYAKTIFLRLNTSYGKARNTLYFCIERMELCKSNFEILNNIINEIFETRKKRYKSLNSEYIKDARKYYNLNGSLKYQCDNCVRNEAIQKTLIIVHKEKGWTIIKDINKIYCPRITQKSPRIRIDFLDKKITK